HQLPPRQGVRAGQRRAAVLPGRPGDGLEMSSGLAVVTGASGGIGAAVARRLHGTGRPLLLLSRRRDEMAALGLDGALLAAVDVRDGDAVAAALARATDRFGPVETLVNNA